MKRQLSVIYAIVLIDIAIGSVIWPILPEFVKGTERPALLLSIGTALFLGVQLFTAPILGKLSDRYGRKPMLQLSALGTLVANFFLLLRSPTGYFINRSADGLTNGIYSTIRAAITDISTKETLARNIGLEGTIVSVGFVIGPILAGGLMLLLGVEDEATVLPLIILGLLLSLVNVLLSSIFIETNKKQTTGKVDVVGLINPLKNLNEFWQLRNLNLRLFRLLMLNGFLVLCLGYYHYYVTFISIGELEMSPKEISFFFTYMGLVNFVISYFFYTRLVQKIEPFAFISVMAIAGVFVLLSYTLIESSKWLLYVIVTIDCITISLIPGVMEGQIGKLTNENNRGSIFGMNRMISSFTSILSATVFGILTIFGIEMPFYWFTMCLIPLIFTKRLMKTTANNGYDVHAS